MSELQSGRTARRASLSRLLSFDEQVSTRSKALVSWCRVFATGGLALNVAPELLRVSCASKAKPPSRRRSQREATPSIAAAYSVTLLEVPYDVLAVSVAAMGRRKQHPCWSRRSYYIHRRNKPITIWFLASRVHVTLRPARRAPAGSLSNVTSNGAPPPLQHLVQLFVDEGTPSRPS